MKMFKDRQGRTWTVDANVTTLRQVKDLLDVDLMTIVEDKGKLLDRLMTDPVLLCDVIFGMCKDEADAKGIASENFGRAMAGDAIASATDVLLEELSDFFRTASQREAFKKLLAKIRMYEDLAGRLGIAKLDDPELDAKIRAEMEKSLDGASSPNAPASSD